MKKTEQVENEYCDVCEQAPAGYSHCINCSKALCYECRKTNAREYSHGVNVGGSGDGLYCLDCDAKLLKSGDKLHAAYRKIEALRNEQSGWYGNFKERSKLAEAQLKALQDNGRAEP